MYMNSEKKMGQHSKYIYFIRFCFILLHVTLRHNLRCLWPCRHRSLPTECLMASAFKFYSYLDEVGRTSMRAENKKKTRKRRKKPEGH